MTENEAIAHARKVAEDKRADADWRWRHGRLNSDDCIKCAEEHEQLADWLEELQQYRAIGTVEECREAMEKQKPKIADIWGDGYADGQLVCDMYDCPNCGATYELDYDEYKFCPKCGQHLIGLDDWRQGR